MKCFCLISFNIYLLQCLVSGTEQIAGDAKREFIIDYANDQFLKDGEPFQYVAGSIHYFRIPSVLWSDRLQKFRAAGLNAIETYVEWSFHEPEPEVYNFDGDHDLIKFVELAQQADLLVILRIGPYICAERDMGGLPYWLLRENPKVKLRTSDASFVAAVDRWFDVLLPKIKPLLYSNNGPIISVQIENEYGSYYACDFKYTSHLRDFVRQRLGNDIILFTTDGNGDGYLKCGKIDHVYPTVDFGPTNNPSFAAQKRAQQHGPKVNSEYYPGWLDHWQSPHSTSGSKLICTCLDKMIAMNASVNFYMFHGGTNFDFGAGANGDEKSYQADPTSYDYDAPLSEAGDPTQKYFDIRNTISKYFPLPNITVPKPSPKMEIPSFELAPIATLFDNLPFDSINESTYPKTFEELSHPFGFVLYSTTISFPPKDPEVLSIPILHDRAQIFIDQEYQGTLSREVNAYSLPIRAFPGSKLDIFVENQGRLGFGNHINDFKGIVSNVTLGSKTLKNWTIKTYFSNAQGLFINVVENNSTDLIKYIPQVPTLFAGDFVLPNDTKEGLDTFLRIDGWQKGVAILNGFNIGRYWPIVGPQVTLYAPAHLFKPYPETNKLLLFELHKAPCSNKQSCTAQFVKNHVINGTTPSSFHEEFEIADIKDHLEH